MEIREPEKIGQLQIAEMLKVDSGDCEVSYEPSNSTLSVTFDKHKIQVPQLLTAVMSVTEINDVQIEETELAQIVKEIYSHGRVEV